MYVLGSGSSLFLNPDDNFMRGIPDRYFVETEAFKDARKLLQVGDATTTESHLLIIVDGPGFGYDA